MEYLLQHKADVNSVNMSGATPLFLAAESIHKEISQVRYHFKALCLYLSLLFMSFISLFSYYWSGRLISTIRISKAKLFLI